MAKADHIVLEGEVIAEEKTHYVVKLQYDHIIKCTLKGKMRQNHIRVLVGDRVQIEMSPYSMEQGWICYRYR